VAKNGTASPQNGTAKPQKRRTKFISIGFRKADLDDLERLLRELRGRFPLLDRATLLRAIVHKGVAAVRGAPDDVLNSPT
jgi:hypothetical protein